MGEQKSTCMKKLVENAFTVMHYTALLHLFPDFNTLNSPFVALKPLVFIPTRKFPRTVASLHLDDRYTKICELSYFIFNPE